MDPDPSHLCCSSAKTSSHYHKVYFHPSFLQAEKFRSKEPRKEFSLAKEKELNFHPYSQKGKEEGWYCANYLPTYLPTHGRKNFLFLPSVFAARNLDTNVIERKVIFTPPFSFFLFHGEEKEERESRIDYGLEITHSLTHYMDTIAAVLPSASASVQEEGGEREKRIAATPLPPKKKLPY